MLTSYISLSEPKSRTIHLTHGTTASDIRNKYLRQIKAHEGPKPPHNRIKLDWYSLNEQVISWGYTSFTSNTWQKRILPDHMWAYKRLHDLLHEEIQ